MQNPRLRVLTDANSLPDITNAERLYLDVETTSGQDGVKSLNPHRDCYIAGIAILAEYSDGSTSDAYYAPVGHRYLDAKNLDWQIVYDWTAKAIHSCKTWVNHNIKYDAHVIINNLALDISHLPAFIDTIVMAKLYDSDRMYKGGYGLAVLSRQLLKKNIDRYENEVKKYAEYTADYGMVPIPILGPYAAMDVVSVYRLYHFFDKNLHTDVYSVLKNECELTRVLFMMEHRGLKVDAQQLMLEEAKMTASLVSKIRDIHARTGRYIEPHVNADCYSLLCVDYGLPVIETTEAGNPAFSADALKQYRVRPDAPTEVLDIMLKYRKDHTYNSLFVTQFRDLHVDEIVHSDYNQIVRTGRMSCKQPNAQQFDKRAKSLILPREGYGFLSADASSQEFRIIASYLKNPEILAAYRENPDADFHQKVADMVGIKRRPAKTLNFSMAFGAGKRNTVGQLANNDDIIREAVGDKYEEVKGDKSVTETFMYLVQKKAELVYDQYHDMLPELKDVSKRAAHTARYRGYIRNQYGRHRHIPEKAAHIAFNSAVQGTAADCSKFAMTSLSRALEGTGSFMLAAVHDSILIEVPLDLLFDEQYLKLVITTLEAEVPPMMQKVDIPMRWSFSIHREAWGKADDVSAIMPDGFIDPKDEGEWLLALE